MIVIVDGGKPIEVDNDVKVILGDGKERHITVTHEGIVIDLVDGGEVVQTRSDTHDKLLLADDEEFPV
jgi:hypothetical protein